MSAFRRDPDLALITTLCRELASLGLNVGMSDARPAAVIYPRVGSCWSVTVDDSLALYEWKEAGKQYPVADPAGAAVLIAEALRARNVDPQGTP